MGQLDILQSICNLYCYRGVYKYIAILALKNVLIYRNQCTYNEYIGNKNIVHSSITYFRQEEEATTSQCKRNLHLSYSPGNSSKDPGLTILPITSAATLNQGKLFPF